MGGCSLVPGSGTAGSFCRGAPKICSTLAMLMPRAGSEGPPISGAGTAAVLAVAAGVASAAGAAVVAAPAAGAGVPLAASEAPAVVSAGASVLDAFIGMLAAGELAEVAAA